MKDKRNKERRFNSVKREKEMRKRQKKNATSKKNTQIKMRSQEVFLSPLERVLAKVHRREAKVLKHLRKYSSFINSKKFLKYPVQLIGWISLIQVLLVIGIAPLKLMFTGLFQLPSMGDIFTYLFGMKDAIFSASPIKNFLDQLVTLIFGVGSFAFIITLVDVEKIANESVLKGTKFPTRKFIIAYFSAYSAVKNLFMPEIFILLVSGLLLFAVMRYFKLNDQRKNDPVGFERSRLLLQEDKIKLSDGSYYNVVTGEISKVKGQKQKGMKRAS
ncbi:hypothetical protein NZ043_27145 [Paenibacillus sp. FSL k6-2145]|uniref:hypothetical protein n=1 Tax=Paenibacillus sp. FSL k6-2145 TaxID=2976834 RepID=UPI0030D90912